MPGGRAIVHVINAVTNLDSLAGKRIAVTGGSGFLGQALVRQLFAAGAEVAVVRHAEYDLVRREDVVRMYHDLAPEIVIHLAAVVGGIGANQANPGRYFYDNLMMGVQLIEEGRQYGVQKIVATGTICAYPKFTPVPFKEDEIWNGYPEETNAPYGLAKKMLLVQAQAYRQQYGTNIIYLLPVNLYGPGDNFNPESSHVIPALIKKCVDAVEEGADSITVWGDGSASREFLYVDDAARGIVLATALYDGSEPVNLGSGMEISIRELVDKIAAATGFSGRIEWDETRPNGQPRRCLDISRARKLFGFEAETDFSDGLARTVGWYRRHRS